MTHDFAKPSTTRKPRASQSKTVAPAKKSRNKKVKSTPKKLETKPPGRVKFIFSLLVLLSLFIYGLYFLQNIPPTNTKLASKMLTSPKKVDKGAAVNKTVVSEKRFNFYEILPESEVKSQKVDEYHYREKNAIDKFYYLVQTGSFRRIQDAEKQKAIVAFQGIKANISTVDNKSGTTWHRVIAGPFHNRSTMNSALDKLVSINISPLVKKVQKDQ